MSRIRTIKPDFWSSEQPCSCSVNARLMFIGMWNFCDDDGIHPQSVFKLKHEIFPSDPFTLEQIKKWMDELIKHKLVDEILIDDKPFWQVSGFKRHQKINRPTSKYMTVEHGSWNTNSVSDHGALIEGREGKGRERSNVIYLNNYSGTPEPHEIIFSIPLKNSKTCAIKKSDIEQWKKLYPRVDVEEEIRNLLAWNLANPDRRKTERGLLKHIFTWLSKARRQGGLNGTRIATSGSVVDRARAEQAQYREQQYATG